jgi:hypothetical protein
MRAQGGIMLKWIQCGVAVAIGCLCAGSQALTVQDVKYVQNPSGHAPLAGLLTCTTDAPATATIVIESPGRETVRQSFPARAGTSHALAALGMVSNVKVSVHAEFDDGKGGKVQTQVFEVQTPPLPEEFAPIKVTASRPRRMEPGVTLVPMMRWPPGTLADEKYGIILALNAAGEVIWYYKVEHPVMDVVALQDGNFAYLAHRANGIMYEADMLGNIVRAWHSSGTPKDVREGSIPIATDTLHHTFEQMPNGNFLMLGTEVRHFDAYPTSESTYPSPTAPSDVIGDLVMEVQPDGKILRQVKLMDLINPLRYGFESLGSGFYQESYAKVLKTPAKDWSHSNAIFYDAKTDSVLLSSRHIDVVSKIDMKTGKLVWLLGNHYGWSDAEKPYLLTPIGDNFAWQYHQHAVKLTPQGTILLYDNGNYRAMPGQEKEKPEDAHSRAVEFKVDEANKTIEKVWSYGEDGSDHFHSPFICDVDWLPKTGNVLITDGGRIVDKDGKPSINIFAGRHLVRIVEVTHESPATKVWEVMFDDPRMGWATFRSERVASLYR